MADQALTVAGAGTGSAAPLLYAVPGAAEIILKGAFARMNGASTSAPWLPCLRVKTPNGQIMLECVGTAVPAGGSADVTWFPGLGGVTGGGGGGITGQAQVRVPIVTPDNSGFAQPALSTANGFSNVRIVFPGHTNGHDSSWAGTIPVPQNYASGPQIIIQTVTQATAGVVRWFVSTSVVAAGSSEDAAWTDETAQNITVPGTAFARQDTIFNLSTVPTAGASLNVKITRNGANAADTCTSVAFVWEAIFQFTVRS